MCVIRGDHKAVRQISAVCGRGFTHCLTDANQRVIQQSRRGSLLAGTSYFFVVEDAVQRNTLSVFCMQKAFQRRKCTLQVIQAAAGNIFFRSTPDTSERPAVYIEIMCQNIIFGNTGKFCNTCHKSAFGGFITVQRKQIFLWIELYAVVGITVHVDRKTWNHDQVFFYIHQFGDNLVPLFHDQTTCYGQWAVKPRGTKHTAVFFHVQFYIVSFRFHLRVLFDLEHRGITVACHDLEAFPFRCRDPECDDGRTVADDIVFSTCLQIPVTSLKKWLVTFCVQSAPHRFDRMKCGWTAFNKRK